MGYDYVRKTKYFNGKKYEATGKTEQEALMKLADKISAAKSGTDTIGGSLTVSQWFDRWMDAYKRNKGLTEKSVGMYDEKFNNHIKPYIGSMKMRDVREVHLQQIVNAAGSKSESHVKKVRLVLQEMFKRARISRVIPYDPAEELELPKSKKGLRRSITDEERSAIIEVAKTHRSGFWIMMLLYTGMRPGETAALKWSDIDMKEGFIFVSSAKESGTHNTIKSPKTEAGIRKIPIHKELIPWLESAPKHPSGYVFVTGEGNRQNENSLRRLWTGFKRALDIYMGAELDRNKIVKHKVAPDLVPYCLRHTFCTDMEKAGVPINIAKEIMGHEDISTTAKIYTHKNDEAIVRGMQILDGTAKEKEAEQKEAELSALVEKTVEKILSKTSSLRAATESSDTIC